MMAEQRLKRINSDIFSVQLHNNIKYVSKYEKGLYSYYIFIYLLYGINKYCMK